MKLEFTAEVTMGARILELIDQKKWTRRLRQAMDKAKAESKLTQTEIANELGIKQASVSDWRNGKKKPDLERIEPLCKLLGITSIWLLFGSNAILASDEYMGRMKKANNLFDRFSKLPESLQSSIDSQIDSMLEALDSAESKAESADDIKKQVTSL